MWFSQWWSQRETSLSFLKHVHTGMFNTNLSTVNPHTQVFDFLSLISFSRGHRDVPHSITYMFDMTWGLLKGFNDMCLFQQQPEWRKLQEVSLVSIYRQRFLWELRLLFPPPARTDTHLPLTFDPSLFISSTLFFNWTHDRLINTHTCAHTHAHTHVVLKLKVWRWTLDPFELWLSKSHIPFFGVYSIYNLYMTLNIPHWWTQTVKSQQIRLKHSTSSQWEQILDIPVSHDWTSSRRRPRWDSGARSSSVHL